MQVVNTEDLGRHATALVQGLPDVSWTVLSAGGDAVDFRAQLRPLADPSRVAVMVIKAGAEVFDVEVCGHTDTDTAYEDAERVATVQDRLHLAVSALHGPTRVTVWRVGDRVVRSRLDLGRGRHRGSRVITYRLGRLTAPFTRQRLAKQVIDLPAIQQGRRSSG